MKLSYISNIKLFDSSGGVSGKNYATVQQLKRNFKITDYCYLNPKPDLFAKISSKLTRLLGFKGKYYFFSNHRLNKINKQFGNSKKSGDIYFFLGFTSWIHVKPDKPYYCFNDASFATYVNIYNDKTEFSNSDLERIYQKEKSSKRMSCTSKSKVLRICKKCRNNLMQHIILNKLNYPNLMLLNKKV